MKSIDVGGSAALERPGTASLNGCGPDRKTRAPRSRLVAQFHKPAGLLGRIAGWIMANRPSNRIRNLWTVSLLGIRPDDRVLEIGYGPGIAIERIAAIVTSGKVVGIDHSETMRRQARKRNARAIRAGRVELRLGAAGRLPAFDEPFDRVLAVNALQFWEDPIAVLCRLRDLMRPGGEIALTFQPRGRGAIDEGARKAGERIAAALQASDFSQVRVELKEMKPVAAICVLGVR